MLLRANGIEIDSELDGDTLTYQVISQSEKFTRNLLRVGSIPDEKTGLVLKSNDRPNFNHDGKRFYVRGKLANRHNDKVVCKFESEEQASKALMALNRMIKCVTDDYKPELKFTPGSTVHLRMALITGPQARILCLTDNKEYPNERLDWDEQVKPVKYKDNGKILADPGHWNEHIGQGIDVMNKSIGNVPPSIENLVVNPHKITSEAAAWTVRTIRKAFDDAEKQGPSHVIALWRLMTALRAPDIKHESDKYSYPV